MDEQKIKEYLVLAVQSGKKETSDLVATIMHKMESRIDSAVDRGIEKNVNGKIKDLTTKVDAYILSDNEWKLNVTPSIEIMKRMQGFASTGGWILKGVVLLGAATTAIWAAIKFIYLDKK